MKKFPALVLFIIVSPLIAGLYGIAHDQLTYTISPEYYTKFKFQQFGLVDTVYEANVPHPRLYVSVVGWMATWWVGIPIGLIIGLIGLMHKGTKRMLQISFKAILLATVVTLLTGLVGLAYGKFHLAQTGVSWWLPENLLDTKNFIAVGSMHNFSYLGGLLGLLTGIVFSIKQKRKTVNAT
jgi:amino acid transporter